MADRSTEGPGDPPHLLARIEHWYVRGEKGSRLALHIHGDDGAREHRDSLVQAIVSLQSQRAPLTLDELSARVGGIGREYGLTGYASNAKCTPDPLETIVDVSLYAARSSGDG